MSLVTVEHIDRAATVVYFPRHCPKCGGETDEKGKCIDCTYSEDDSLTPEEAREFTCAGD
jgi:tRNA(Ile2) C34 agmatinyltransferase TiaS